LRRGWIEREMCEQNIEILVENKGFGKEIKV
jgi:hypothetical protein